MLSGTEARLDLPPVDSVPRRFAVTLAANVVKLAVGVATASVVPRSLGARDYGSYQFLTAAAGTFRTFLDFGASTAAYTFSAKHRRSGLAALLYGRWLLIQLAVILLLVVLADRLGLASRIWPGQGLRYVYVIAGLEWLTFIGNFLLQLGDAKAETVRVQKLGLVTQAVRLGLLLLLYGLGVLALDSFLLLSFVVAAFTVAAVAGTFVIPKWHQYFRLDLPEPDRRACIAFFVSYGRPLALIGVAVFVHDFFDRWLLQILQLGFRMWLCARRSGRVWRRFAGWAAVRALGAGSRRVG